MFGPGIYSSPSLKTVDERYAQEFSYGGKKYKIAFQTRVNPDRVKIIPATKTGVEAEYWISQEGDIRPYGVITKEIVASGCHIFLTIPQDLFYIVTLRQVCQQFECFIDEFSFIFNLAG